MINYLKRLKRRFKFTTKYTVFEACFINNMWPLGPDLHDTSFQDGYVYFGIYKTWHDCIYDFSKHTKKNVTPMKDDILVLTCHADEHGYLMLGGQRLDINVVIRSLKNTEIRTIILGCCYGDRVLKRLVVDGGYTIIYNHLKIRDEDTAVMIRRMIEGLDLWSLKESVSVINTMSDSLWGYYES